MLEMWKEEPRGQELHREVGRCQRREANRVASQRCTTKEPLGSQRWILNAEEDGSPNTTQGYPRRVHIYDQQVLQPISTGAQNDTAPKV